MQMQLSVCGVRQWLCRCTSRCRCIRYRRYKSQPSFFGTGHAKSASDLTDSTESNPSAPAFNGSSQASGGVGFTVLQVSRAAKRAANAALSNSFRVKFGSAYGDRDPRTRGISSASGVGSSGVPNRTSRSNHRPMAGSSSKSICNNSKARSYSIAALFAQQPILNLCLGDGSGRAGRRFNASAHCNASW